MINLIFRNATAREKQRYYFSRDPQVSEELLDDDGLPCIFILSSFFSFLLLLNLFDKMKI